MTHQPLSTHPVLQNFFQLRMTNGGQLIVDEEVAYQHKKRNVMSGCCRQEIYHMDGKAFCGYCGAQTDPY